MKIALLILFTYAARSYASTGGYVVSIKDAATTAGSAILTNVNYDGFQSPLACRGAFQSESTFMLFCSSSDFAADQNARVRLFVNNVMNPQAEVLLTVVDEESEKEFTLKCIPGPDPMAPANGASCR